MRLDLARAIGAQATIRAAVKQLREQVFGGGGHDLGTGEVQRLGEDLAVHFVGVFVVVGWEAGQHFVQEHAERPPVDGLGVALAE